jgi:transposase InsO family protein
LKVTVRVGGGQIGGNPEARAAVAAWIEDYNHVWRHSALGMKSQVDYERSLAGKDVA